MLRCHCERCVAIWLDSSCLPPYKGGRVGMRVDNICTPLRGYTSSVNFVDSFYSVCFATLKGKPRESPLGSKLPLSTVYANATPFCSKKGDAKGRVIVALLPFSRAANFVCSREILTSCLAALLRMTEWGGVQAKVRCHSEPRRLPRVEESPKRSPLFTGDPSTSSG